MMTETCKLCCGKGKIDGLKNVPVLSPQLHGYVIEAVPTEIVCPQCNGRGTIALKPIYYPISPEARQQLPPDINSEDWTNFLLDLADKMRAGAIEHGSKTLDLTPAEVLRELSNEALDLAGWGFFLWRKTQNAIKLLPDN